jgi:hypothetical protein
MAYFSNGTEGDMYQEKYCENCDHWKLDEDTETWGCPVMDLHYEHNRSKDETIKTILEILIPTNEETTFAEPCKMMVEKKKKEEPCYFDSLATQGDKELSK